MARTPKGKPTTGHSVRVDEDVWAALQAMPSVNEGLRAVLVDALIEVDLAVAQAVNAIPMCSVECEHKAEAEFLHGEVRALQTELEAERKKPTAMSGELALPRPSLEALRGVLTQTENGNAPAPIVPAPEKKRELSVAERRALEEKQRLELLAACDERARLVGREDIEYDLEAAPSKATPLNVSPRAERTQPIRKANYKTLNRPHGGLMSKKGHEQRHD